MDQIRAGQLYFRINGVQYAIAGDFTINAGLPTKEAVIGMDGSVGYKVTPRQASIEGNVRDHSGLDVKTLLGLEGVTVTAEMANGKTWVLANATQVGEGDISPDESTLGVRFEAQQAEEQV